MLHVPFDELAKGGIYPKGLKPSWFVRLQFMVRDYEESLVDRLPNEFRHALQEYNHRNGGIIDWYVDSNDYTSYY